MEFWLADTRFPGRFLLPLPLLALAVCIIPGLSQRRHGPSSWDGHGWSNAAGAQGTKQVNAIRSDRSHPRPGRAHHFAGQRKETPAYGRDFLALPVGALSASHVFPAETNLQFLGPQCLCWRPDAV